MQLKAKNMRGLLGAAAAALLGQAAPAVAADWELDSALAVYDEVDGVRAVSPTLQLSRLLPDERRLSLRLSYDSLSGASPTGASGAAQTVTSPSGKPVQIGSGSGLIYAPFADERHAIDLEWNGRLGERTRYTLGAGYSSEIDFRAASARAQLSQGFLKNNLVLTVGGAFESDRVDPVGGTPQPFALNGGQAKGGASSRQQWDALLSATLTLSPLSEAYFAAGGGRSQGYLTDPYKVVTVVDPDSGEPVDGQAFDPDLGPNEKKANLYEKRPDERQRYSLFAEYRRALGADALVLNYRYTEDDWHVRSHTAETRYRWAFASRWTLEPSLRLYRQSAAYFYRYSLVNYRDISGDVINVRYASADRRLAGFDALTAALSLGWTPTAGQRLTLRAAYYRQAGDSHPADAIGAQRSIDYFPVSNAVWAQLLYRYAW